jgi:protein phosphatase
VRGAGLCVVADGMGGCNAGEVASRFAVQATCESVERWLGALAQDPASAARIGEEAPEALAAAVIEANRRVYEAGHSVPDMAGMGTTLTAALFIGSQLTVAHVGDCRCLLLRSSELRQITADHSVVGELVRNGGLTESQAMAHPQRNVLTRALGTDPVLAIDLWQEPLCPDDLVLLCSDGVSRHLSNVELSRLALGHDSPQRLADAVIDLANSRGGYDNLTIVVVRWQGPDRAGCSAW